MALSIGVVVGSEINIEQDCVTVVEIHPTAVILLVESTQKRHLIQDSERTEILPSVFVSLGSNIVSNASGTRLAFEAPRYITIKRVRSHA